MSTCSGASCVRMSTGLASRVTLGWPSRHLSRLTVGMTPFRSNREGPMRNLMLCMALVLSAPAPAHSQSDADDPKALTVLTRMADNIGALHSCTFRLDASYDEWDA